MDIKNKFLLKIIRQRQLFYMIIPIMAYVFVFHYMPLRGWAMAFQNFRPGRDHHDWVGFDHFQRLFSEDRFFRVMRNTLAMSSINLVLGFVCAIVFALLLNEIKNRMFKRTVQTISYLPHFLSWVIASSMIMDFLLPRGILNTVLVSLGILDSPRLFLGEANSFWAIIGISNIWKSVGWNSIIYLAAISSIDPSLYESAELDGAGRFARMWHITLPSIKPTILVLLIMNIGWILNAGYEPQFLMGNALTWHTAETIDVYVMRYGIGMLNFSLGTAMGMFKTAVSIVLITGANQLSKKFAKESLV